MNDFDRLYADIETIPAQRPDVLEEIRAAEQASLDGAIAAVRAPGNYGPEAAEKWMAEKGQAQIADLHARFDAAVDEAYRKTALDGAFGQIAVVSIALNDDEPHTFYMPQWADPEAERYLLQSLDFGIRSIVPAGREFSVQVIGHNVAAFDLRFLTQRCIVNGIRPHVTLARAASAKPWEAEKVFDTMVQWAGVGNKVKLDKLCRVLGVPCKGEIDGSKVWDYVQAGRIEEVAAYCADDVRRARAVHRRMTFAHVESEQLQAREKEAA